jgi:hypothetical protein
MIDMGTIGPAIRIIPLIMTGCLTPIMEDIFQ